MHTINTKAITYFIGQNVKSRYVYMNTLEIINYNIIAILKERQKTINELADILKISKSTLMRKLENKSMFTANELKQISAFLGTSIESLASNTSDITEADIIKRIIKNTNSAKIKEGLEVADQIADMICFYNIVMMNANAMKRSYEM